MRCRHCGGVVASAAGIYVHADTGRPEAVNPYIHYARPE